MLPILRKRATLSRYNQIITQLLSMVVWRYRCIHMSVDLYWKIVIWIPIQQEAIYFYIINTAFRRDFKVIKYSTIVSIILFTKLWSIYFLHWFDLLKVITFYFCKHAFFLWYELDEIIMKQEEYRTFGDLQSKCL